MKKIQGNDSFQRINYLYQISKQIVQKNSALSSYYGNLIINIAKKNVQKIHPDIKRQICKKCRCMLKDRISARTRIKTIDNVKLIEWKCLTCGTMKRLPTTKGTDYRLWVEKPEAIAEVIG